MRSMFKLFDAPTVIGGILSLTALRSVNVNLHKVNYAENGSDPGVVILYFEGGGALAVMDDIKCVFDL